MMTEPTRTAIYMGREHIAKLAEANGEIIFAREVRGGCWDHRSDVKTAIERVQREIENSS